ncbi:hypothetical protein Tco_0703936 [Tanacetum coccineum]|uniref:Uncharacterized protein n=1 Tax=Tanacetum coccineum TaxID=301880 RepID=A0ABQ4Y209_9ASTR
MTISLLSLKKSESNITNTSTNKAFQVSIDPSRLQSPFNSRYELIALCRVLFSLESRIHTQIEPLDLEFLDSVSQCFQNTRQRTGTELVYFIKPHDLSFIVVDREHYCSRRLNDGIIMHELVSYSIPSWFSEVQLSLIAFNTEKMIEMTLQKEQIQVFKVTGIQVLEILFSNRVFLVIGSSEDNFTQVVIPIS